MIASVVPSAAWSGQRSLDSDFINRTPPGTGICP
jgi:hypothetical protein